VKRQLTEVAWVVAGQAATALGTLVGVRILTQFLSPEGYGVVSLATGLSVLAINLVAAPITQAAIHFYPGVVANGSASELLAAVLRCYRTMAPWIAATALVGGGVYLFYGHGSATLIVVLGLLFACDCWRSANLSLLNAARRQERYGLWMAADAWSRPLAASLVVVWVGTSPALVLASYLVVSMCLLVTFSRGLWPAEGMLVLAAQRAKDLDTRMWAYALPLVPLGIISWASTLGDRYVIGGLLGLADAGIYAAVYGLSNSPFMILNGMVEQALRPIYQTAVTRGDHARSRRILAIWLAVVISAGLAGVAVFIIGHDLLASLFVGKQYRGGASLMPWIGAGYAIRATSYVFERVCYAFGKTRRVLAIQLCAVVATLALTPAGVITLGLKGAAMAVPAYFSVQLIAAVFFACRTIREAREGGSVGGVIASHARAVRWRSCHTRTR
jgi:O-antigen/teichoic acid export membrane protein